MPFDFAQDFQPDILAFLRPCVGTGQREPIVVLRITISQLGMSCFWILDENLTNNA